MAVTLHDVADAAGVSIKTVSNVVRRQGHFSEQTRDRVETAIAELGYRPNLAARGLKSGRLGVIGLVVPYIRNPYFAELADAVMRAAAADGLLVVVEQSDGDPATELELLRGRQAQIVDGLLFSVLGLAGGGEDLTDSVDLPVVVLGEPVPGWQTDWVSMNHTDAVEEATLHLLDSGRRRIAAIGAANDGVGSASLRLEGYRRALRARDIDVDPQLIRVEPTWGRAEGFAVATELLDAGAEFDGLVAFNDALALGAMRALEEHGVRVPDDVAVIGFDDIDETRYSNPTLSTIRPELEHIATTAVGYLRERIERSDTALAPRGYRAPCSLLIRQSTTVSADVR